MAQPIAAPPKSKATGWLRNPGGPTPEEAKAEMVAASEPVSLTRGTFVPKHLNTTSLPATPPVTPTRVAAQPAAQPAQPARQPASQPAAQSTQDPASQSPISHREVLDELDFVIETYKDNRDNKWHGVIRYKPDASGKTPGSEQYVANSQSELTLKIIKGKAHSTLKIRSLTQSHKMGGRPDLREAHDLEMLKLNNLTIPEFNALPEKSKALLRETAYSNEVLKFKDQFPQYELSSDTGIKNLQAVVNYINKQGWPITVRNLEIGWNDLESANKLEIAEVPALQSVAPIAPSMPSAPAQPVRKRGNFTTGIVPGQSSGQWATGADDDTTRAREASAQANQANGGMTPEQRVRELSKTKEGFETLKREMRKTFKPAQPSYRG
jgi:hypothetical protein